MAVIELLPAQIGLDVDAGRGAAIEREVLDRCQRVVMCAPLRIDPGPIDRRWLQRRAGAAQRHQQRGTDAQQMATHDRSEEHTSELQSLMRISYAVFCLKKKKNT